MTRYRPISPPRAAVLALLACFANLAWAGDPKATTDDAKARLATVGGADKYDADAVIVLDATDVLVRPSGIGESTARKILKVLREPAIRGQAVQRFDYDPTTNRLTIQAVRVYRADGRVEEID